MKSPLCRLVLVPFAFLTLAFFAAQPAEGGDWPQWLGPNRDGSSTETIVPWKEKPKPAWRLRVGDGHSSPVVKGGKVYLHFKDKESEGETLICVDGATGKQEWEKTLPRNAFSNKFGNGPRATPLIHKDKIFTHGASGQLACHELADGKLLWKRDLLTDFGAKNLYFGASGSPVAVDDSVLVPVGGKGAAIVALNIADGSTIWKAVDETSTYSSPVVRPDGNVYFLSQGGVQVVSVKDGKPVAKFPLVDRLNESATTPVFLKDGLFASSVTYGGVFLDTKPGDNFLKSIWKKGALSCYFSTPVPDASGDYLYMVTGALSLIAPPSSNLKCVDVKTGNELWSRPKTGKYHAALMRLADGKMLLVDDFGDLRLFEPSKEKYNELAVTRICGATWAHPALCDGTLYIRDDGFLIAVKLPTK